MPDKTIENHIIIATNGMVDYEKLIKTMGGEVVNPGNGYAFNPFKDATPEQTEAFTEAYCALYPDGAREIIREKVRNEIEKVKNQNEL